MKFDRSKMLEALGRVILRMHYPLEVMLVCVRRYAAYPLSLRHIEEMMIERDVCVDHSTAQRGALKILPALALVFRRRKRSVGRSRRMDVTYVKVCGQWKYLYRAVDRDGHTVDFLRRAHRDAATARRFLERAIDLHGVPEKITIDKSGANTAGHTVVCLPYVMRTTIASLAQLDPGLLEASESLGAGRWLTFRRVTLPLIGKGVGAGAFIAFMASFDNVPVSLFLADARTELLPIHMWQIIDNDLDVRTAAVSGVLIAFTVILMLVAERFAGLTRQIGR